MELYIKKRLGNFLMIVVPIMLVLGVLLYFVWYFVFNIYDVSVEVSNYNLYADDNSYSEIYVYPVNYFGKKVPFREIESNFEISEGENLINVVKKDRTKILVKSKNLPGSVKIVIKNRFSLFPIIVDLVIKSNYA